MAEDDAPEKTQETDLELDQEIREWMDAELAPPLEPYDWGDEDPLAYGQPVRYVPGEGLWVALSH